MRFSGRHTMFFLLLLIILQPDLLAQTPHLKQISLSRGKDIYTVHVVHQDHQGWIWLGSDHGLFRYDGINYEVFTENDSLADNRVSALATDNDDRLWIGHRNGMISLLDSEGISVFRPEEGLGSVEITDIELDSASNIWYATLGEGIFRYNGRFLSNFNTDDGLSDNYVYDIEFDEDGSMWLATDYGITHFFGDSSETISMKDGLSDNIVREVKIDRSGNIWLGTDEGGLSVFDCNTKELRNLGDWQFGAITGIAIGLDNDYWVSTSRNGIIRVRFHELSGKPVYQHITTKQGLISDRIHDVLYDKESNIWIAGSGGLVQALPPMFEFLNVNNGMPFNMAYSFTSDSSGNYWICSEKGLYTASADESGQLIWRNLSEELDLGVQNFISVYRSVDNSIWAGTYGYGVFHFEAGGRLIGQYTTDNGLTDNNVLNISGGDSLIWFSTLGGGLPSYNIQSGRIYGNQLTDLDKAYLYSVKEGPDKRLWVAGSYEAPLYIENNRMNFIPLEEGNFKQLYGIAIDTSGQVWFHSGDQGLVTVIEEDAIHYGPEDGITSTEIQSIIFDELNRLLVVSNEGITVFKPGEGSSYSFGENTGLAFQYPILNAVYKDEEGHIWIGTETGLIKYNSAYSDRIEDTPRIFLSRKDLFNQSITGSLHKFRHHENNFTFAYTGLWYRNPQGLNFRSMLEGYDLEWSFSNRNQERSYSKLPAGKYTFVAQASLDGVRWIDSPDSTYTFEIKPPFWRRWWFILLMVVILISAVFAYIRMRLANLQRAKIELEKEVENRTEEIREKNHTLENQKEEIAAQRDMAEQQRDQIEDQKDEIQSSIRYAQRIQGAALPPVAELDRILPEHFVLNKPRDIVSGDFFWIAERKGYIFFCVADCTGHGVPGAFMSMLGLSAMNDIIKTLDTCSASFMLDELNLRIKDALHKEKEHEYNAKDGMDISLCILDTTARKIQFAGGFNPLYLYRKGVIEIIRADKISIGGEHIAEEHFTNHEISLQEGDQLYLFSDGFPDQFGGPQGKKYKYKPFREYLLSIAEEDMKKQQELLDKEIEDWKKDLPQIDDIMVMGVRVR